MSPSDTTTTTTTTSNAARKVTLRSSDGEEMLVDEAVAMESKIVKNCLEDSDSDNVVNLPNVDGKSLAKIVRYCTALREGEEDLFKAEDNNSLKDLVLAANYLEIKDLLDLLVQAVADRIANRSVEYVRKFFVVENDYTPEEEADLRRQHEWAFQGVEEDD